jgi:hypothetical protein
MIEVTIIFGSLTLLMLHSQGVPVIMNFIRILRSCVTSVLIQILPYGKIA